jgi:uncharacterized protein YtpQ (UPF0354 family)
MAVLARATGIAFTLAMAAAAAFGAPSADADAIDTSADNLIVVLRESAGENKADDTLQPYGRVTAQMPDGRRIDLATSWYRYLGDMHIRLVFDGGQTLQSASPNDLERLQLTPEDALSTAVTNLRRVYGAPVAVPWSGGLMQVQAKSPELASSYFLDRDFWELLQQAHPAGIVAAVPQREGIVFADLDDEDAVEALRFSAAALYASAGGTRISSALYLFKDGRWSVFQPPRRQ